MSEERLVPPGREDGRSAEGGRPRRRFLGSRARVEWPAPKPRGVGEQLDFAFELLRANFLGYVGIAFVLWLPVRIVAAIQGPINTDPMVAEVSDQLAFLGQFIAQIMVQLFVVAFATAQLVMAIATFE